MGVLRWQIALDARLSKLLARPDQRLAEPVALALASAHSNFCTWTAFPRTPSSMKASSYAAPRANLTPPAW